jgi:branched-chain amino acid transport system ATP-binding protein
VSEHLLQVESIQSFYGDAQALFDVRLEVAAGEFVTLLGRNGMGKTTTVRSIMGIMTPRHGRVVFKGQDITGWPSYKVARLGIGLVPEQRQVFPNLSVRENLIATAGNRLGHAGPWTLERVYSLFPRLKERAKNLGANLSGGEQQMLAIGRALMTNPQLLILDEATEGLAPIVRAEIWDCLQTLKASGL